MIEITGFDVKIEEGVIPNSSASNSSIMRSRSLRAFAFSRLNHGGGGISISFGVSFKSDSIFDAIS